MIYGHYYGFYCIRRPRDVIVRNTGQINDLSGHDMGDSWQKTTTTNNIISNSSEGPPAVISLLNSDSISLSQSYTVHSAHCSV